MGKGSGGREAEMGTSYVVFCVVIVRVCISLRIFVFVVRSLLRTLLEWVGGMWCHGIAWHSTACHGTAWHDMAFFMAFHCCP